MTFLRLLLGIAVAIAAAAPASPDSDSTSSTPADSLDITASVMLAAPGGEETLPSVSRPFTSGERLKFSVQYGFIHAGTAYLEVPEVRDWNGRPVYSLVARAESNAFFSRIYKVRNRIESLWDTTGHFSWRYSENRREGGHKAQNQVVFDYDKQLAEYPDGRTFPVPPGVQDALSAFYFTRLQALPLGGSVVFDYHASRKSQPLEVRVIGRERVTTPAGKFDCVVIEPVLKAGGIFKNKGRLVIWITEDERRMPVMMKSKVTVGSISVLLVEATPGA